MSEVQFESPPTDLLAPKRTSFETFIARFTPPSIDTITGPEASLRGKITALLPGKAADLVAKTLNFSRRPTEQPAPVFPEEAARDLLIQDALEQVTDRACIAAGAAARAMFLEEMARIFTAELAKRPQDRSSSTAQAVLVALADQIPKILAELRSLQDRLSTPQEIDPFITSQETQNLLGEYGFLISQSASLATSSEMVSPARGHNGPMTAKVQEISTTTELPKTSGYSRFRPGIFARMLAGNIDAQYRLPQASNVSRKEVAVYSSGMGGLGSVLEALANLNSEMVISDGFYFELPAVAKKTGLITDTTPVDEEYYLSAAGKLRQETVRPITFFAQPFSSGMEANFDLDRLLKVIETSDFSRPVYIVLDTTMHGPSLQNWDRINALNRGGKNVTYIEVQSLVKHGQLGLDKVPGGVVIAYGSNPDVINSAAGTRGALMQEFAAACLFPFSSETQLHRIHRAGRNAEHLSNFLQELTKDNPLFGGVFYSSADTRQDYATKSPFLFLKINPLVKPYFDESLAQALVTASHTIPDTTEGTSYGFNGTRFESIPIGPNRSDVIRIAAGQQSILNIMALEAHLERMITNPSWIENASGWLNREIDTLIADTLPRILRAPRRTAFNPHRDPQNSTHSALNEITNRDANGFLLNSFRGYQISAELTNPKLREKLNVPQEKLDELNSLLPPVTDVKAAFIQWQIVQPEFIDAFRTKLTVAGKSPSPEAAYLLAHAATDIKGVRIVLAPVAKLVNDVLKQIQPIAEVKLGAPLPFNL